MSHITLITATAAILYYLYKTIDFGFVLVCIAAFITDIVMPVKKHPY